MSGHLLEAFTSYQGEGPYAGARQFFIRLGGCHLRCVYCDTPDSWERKPAWKAERMPLLGTFEERCNPAATEDLLSLLDGHRDAARIHSVSFTGGEPLLQPEFLRELMSGVRARGMPVYLETSGTLADRLARVADLVDIFAFDIKLPSCPGVRMEWADARACLDLAHGREAFVKIVVTQDSPVDEIARAAALVPGDMPIFLQPATPVNAASRPPDGAVLSALRKACGREVSVMPQLHPLAGWR